nr:PREDICTED: cytokinin dehydrogenase 6-like isoform X2 [Musa acuminata subsp. malaccensis]
MPVYLPRHCCLPLPSFLPPLVINSPPAFLPFFAHSYLESPQPMSPQRLSHIPPSFLITLPQGLLELDIADRIYVDPDTTTRFSTDFGRLTRAPPSAVLYPSSPDDIAALVRFSYFSLHPFTVAARGCGHSVRGQALAPGGVVVDMPSLGRGRDDRINVSRGDGSSFWYVDVGGEQLWIDVLHETLKHGLAPRSWTDYLHLTVGGTLSNAGVSGQAFRHGPQISNVYELEVVTGKGEMMICSHNENPALFYGVLGGLGQLGIITRARIAVEPAPERVRWARLIYTDFVSFTRDQELLISMSEEGFDYVEGSLLMMDHSLIGNWRSSFFSDRDWEKVKLLASQFGAIYCLEGAVYYELATASSVDQLSFVPGFAFAKDVSYMAFLDRVHDGEMKLRSMGLWDVPHPWLNIFVPKSRIRDFEIGVFKGILKPNNSMGPVLIYPLKKNKWDEKMSAVIPDEEIFYSIGLLRSAIMGDWEHLDDQNDEILRFCHREGIEYKQYLPHYTAQTDWMKHFGLKWNVFVDLKRRYDPKLVLSPGHRIFTSSLIEHVSEQEILFLKLY